VYFVSAPGIWVFNGCYARQGPKQQSYVVFVLNFNNTIWEQKDGMHTKASALRVETKHDKGA